MLPQPTVTPCCTPSPTPVIDEALAESDQFWATWLEPIHFGLTDDVASLADATAQAHLVVRGRITDLYIGEYWQMEVRDEPLALAYVSVEIQEVLKGEPVSRTLGTVEVQIGEAGPDLEELRAALPAHDHLWFLMFEPDMRPRVPPNETEIAPFVYFATNEYQGVLRGINGVVRVNGPRVDRRVIRA